MSDEILFFAIPAALFIAGLWGGFVAVKKRSRPMMIGFGGVWLAFTVLMFLAMALSGGWDGILYAMVLAFAAGPSGAGLLIGSVLGLLERRKTTDG